MRQEVKKIGPGAAMGGAGGVLLHAAVLMFAVTLAAALSLAMPIWLAFLFTGIALAIAGGALVLTARNKLRTVELKPAVTIHKLEEDQQWAKGLTQKARSNLRQDT
ncbi:MAG: phage holin family protein [Myxococcales bacterium]